MTILIYIVLFTLGILIGYALGWEKGKNDYYEKEKYWDEWL